MYTRFAALHSDSCGRIVGLGVVIVLATMFILTLCCGLVALKIACTRKCGKVGIEVHCLGMTLWLPH